MNKYQKIAALVIRLCSLGFILYTTIASIPVAFMVPQGLWIQLPSLIAGILVFLAAIPLAKIATAGIDE